MSKRAKHRAERKKSSVNLKQISAVCLMCGLAATTQSSFSLQATESNFNAVKTNTVSAKAEKWIVNPTTPSAKSTTVINVSWPQTGSYTSYLLQWSTSSSFTSPGSATVNSLTFDITSLTSATQYYFRVRPVGSPTGTWSTPTTTKTIYTAIDTKYEASNGPTVLGTATSPETPIRDGGFYRCYQTGCIIYSPTNGAYLSLNGPIRTTWASFNYETGYLGYPKSDEIVDVNGGKKQNYEGGIIVLEPSQTTAYSIHNGPILTEYLAGGVGLYEYPIAEQAPVSKYSGMMQSFKKFDIYWSSNTGTYYVFKPGGIGQLWKAYGGINGFGYPTSKEIGGLTGGGAKQSYEIGTVYWTLATNAQLVRGGIFYDWNNAGAENSRFGYPTSMEYSWNGVTRQDFQHGYITWNNSTGSSFYYT